MFLTPTKQKITPSCSSVRAVRIKYLGVNTHSQNFTIFNKRSKLVNPIFVFIFRKTGLNEPASSMTPFKIKVRGN